MPHVTEITIKILAGLLIWFCTSTFILGVATFDGGNYRLDDNYMVGGWPGRIWKRAENTTSFRYVRQIEAKIEKFSVADKYILLKAGNEWYAINRQDHVISQFVSLQDLKDALKFQSNIHFSTSRPWLRLRFFWPAALISITSGICIFVLLLFKEIKNLILPRHVSLEKNKKQG